MEFILNIVKSDLFLIGILVGIIILFLLYIINIVKLLKLRKNYLLFMKKLGNGQDIRKSIENYMEKIDQVSEENKQIKNYCEQLDKTMIKCIQKIGLVRYNAFKDTGSDLSFTLALLNEENSGIVLNGIYSREMSNIYSKPVEQGMSSYTLSDEEKQAIQKAINQ